MTLALQYLAFSPSDCGQVRLRLVCFPYAGAGASVYAQWARLLPPYIQVVAVQLPGRESHLRHSPISNLHDLLPGITSALIPLFDMPVALFGHSMGALLAFEVAHALAPHRLAPIHLFASGAKAPHLSRADRKRADFTDDELIEEVQRLNGEVPESLQNPELRNLILPALRADFLANDNYECLERAPLRCPITALGGVEDEWVDRDGLGAWRVHTSSAFALHMMPGGHLFINSERKPVTQLVTRILELSFYLMW